MSINPVTDEFCETLFWNSLDWFVTFSNLGHTGNGMQVLADFSLAVGSQQN